MGKESNLITAKNKYTSLFKDYVAYISSSEKIKSYTGDKDFFMGGGDIRKPEAMSKVSLGNSSGLRKI